jgi:hypothetical protein
MLSNWRRLAHAEMGEIVAADPTTNDADDPAQIGSLLGQVAKPVASFAGDGAYDKEASIVLWRTTSRRPVTSYLNQRVANKVALSRRKGFRIDP